MLMDNISIYWIFVDWQIVDNVRIKSLARILSKKLTVKALNHSILKIKHSFDCQNLNFDTSACLLLHRLDSKYFKSLLIPFC